MSIEEKTLSPQEGMQLIAEAITKAKEDIKENSFCFLLWGWLIAGASFLFFLLHQYTSFKYYFLPFPVLAVAGVVITIIYYRKKVKSSTLSYLTVFLYRMWLVLAISFFAAVFINISQNHLPFTDTLLIAAIGTMASGLVMKFNPLIIGGILLFAASIASVYVDHDYKVLLHGIAIVFGYLIPGYLLKFSDK